MTVQEYKPRAREVAGEITRSLVEKVRTSAREGFLHSTKEFALNTGKAFAWLNIAPYILPSITRFITGDYQENAIERAKATLRTEKGRWVEVDTAPKERITDAEGYGLLIGGITAMFIGTVTQASMYIDATEKGYGNFALLIPVATNITSGMYELGRRAYRNAELRLLEKKVKEAGK